MEAIWIFPLYIIIPIIGFVLTFKGIFKIRKGDTNKTLYKGLALLSLPLIHLALVALFNLKLEHKIIGNYNLGKEKNILVVYDNQTFSLKKSNQNNNFGKGKWKIEIIDSPMLILDFDSIKKSDLWLEIETNNKEIILKAMPNENEILTDFIKTE